MTVPSIRSTEIAGPGTEVARMLRPRLLVVELGANDQSDLGRAADLSPFAQWPGRILWVAAPNAPATLKAMRTLAAGRGERVFALSYPSPDGIHPERSAWPAVSAKLDAECAAESAKAASPARSYR